MMGASLPEDHRLTAVRRASAAGDLAGAASLAEAAIRDGLHHPMLVGVIVARREQEGRFEEALSLLRQLKTAVPPNVAVPRAAGLNLLRLDRLAEAIAEFDEALGVDPRSADVLAHRAMALTGLGQIGAARQGFEAALAADPANAIALSGLAGLALRRGEAGEARRLASLALAESPAMPSAVLTVAGADLSEGRPADAERAMRALADSRTVDLRDRVIAVGLLGEALDAQKRFDEAFAAWRGANELLREAYRSAFEGQPRTLALVRSFTETLRHRRFPRSEATS